MKFAKTALVFASVFVMSSGVPAIAGPKDAALAPVVPIETQIAENRAPAVRNISAAVSRTAGRARQIPGKPRGPNPNKPGAQALMVLGLALVATPAMFGGAFSN